MQPPKLKPALELPLPAVLPDAVALRSAEDEVLRLHDEASLRLLRYARAVGLNDEEAEDVVQDVFVALFRHLCLERPRHSLTGWLFRVTRNLALKQRRRQSNAPAELLSALLLERVVDPGDTPEEQAAFGERRRRLQSVVRALDPRARQCLYLRSEGLSYRDIAGALGVSLGSVSNALARAFGRLTSADER
jgi:RNA polymerase sigma-70 factor (ECF subfamily)